MYNNVQIQIDRVQAKIEDLNYQMVEAEGDELFKLESKMERLEAKLERLIIMQNDMDAASSYEE